MQYYIIFDIVKKDEIVYLTLKQSRSQKYRKMIETRTKIFIYLLYFI